MDSARGPAPRTGSWDASGFLRVWQRLDPQGRGYLDDKELDAFCRQMLTTLGTDVSTCASKP
ncbi:hypothetical protein QTO34_010996 [Cnephaeus nilssonii]|uniref:EF-hand domain-containing protein n=1 Tax=Cnephaeus nilssonii TaxID=3371016 RepID=A0AA40HDG7_CNENI|nr:hypothetical protein QTO34_010996 [Eptesicus nilssonii]